MASLSQALRLGDLPPPHTTFQGHAPHIIEWSMMLRPNDSWSTCILQGIATFLHYASRRSAGLRYTTRWLGESRLWCGRWSASWPDRPECPRPCHGSPVGRQIPPPTSTPPPCSCPLQQHL